MPSGIGTEKLVPGCETVHNGTYCLPKKCPFLPESMPVGCSFAFRPCCTFLLIVVSCGGSAWATVLTTGDVTPGGGGLQPDPWGISGKLKIGEFGIGHFKFRRLKYIKINLTK